MADELKTDEERAEELKAWWRSNGTSVLAGIAIAIGGVFGWQQWQNYQQNESEAGSAQLQAAQASDANSRVSVCEFRRSIKGIINCCQKLFACFLVSSDLAKVRAIVVE